MRAKLLGLLLGCGLAAAAISSAAACSYHMTTASDGQSTQQTAQADAAPTQDSSAQ
jgi:hypothetical protein